jgi:hypothetical protein
MIKITKLDALFPFINLIIFKSEGVANYYFLPKSTLIVQKIIIAMIYFRDC